MNDGPTRKSSTFTGPQGSSSIPPELITLNSWYSFTLNKECPYPRTHTGVIAHYDGYKKFLKDHLNIPNLKYVFYMEQSRYGRPHLHGRICFCSPESIVWFFGELHTWLAHYELDSIKDIKVWDEYCTKQSKSMMPFLERFNRKYKLTPSKVNSVETVTATITDFFPSDDDDKL